MILYTSRKELFSLITLINSITAIYSLPPGNPLNCVDTYAGEMILIDRYPPDVHIDTPWQFPTYPNTDGLVAADADNRRTSLKVQFQTCLTKGRTQYGTIHGQVNVQNMPGY